MKRFALIALGLASLLMAPAIGQSYVSDAEPFISAVDDRDGDSTTVRAGEDGIEVETTNR